VKISLGQFIIITQKILFCLTVTLQRYSTKFTNHHLQLVPRKDMIGIIVFNVDVLENNSITFDSKADLVVSNV